MTSGPVDEQLSAWLDDELSTAELELLATRLAQDPARRATLARYGLIGACLRSDPTPVGAALNLGRRVATALEAPPGEGLHAPEVALPRPPARRQVPRTMFAAAAAVALAAVLLVAIEGPPGQPGGAVPTARLTTAGAASATLGVPVPTQAQASLSSRRLTGYLVRHGEYSGFLSAKVTDSHIVNNRAVARLVSTSEPASR